MKLNTRPLITIITATFNSESVIERCINSVINQTYKNIEYIIIDGNSKDKTVSILRKYDSSIKKWISESDTGVYDAWNKGLELATGDWIAFIGSDDVLYNDAMENYVNYINNSELEYDFISSRVHVVNMNGKILRTLGWAWNWKTSRRENNIAHPGALHNRRLFKEYGKFDTKYLIVGDYELMLRAGEGMKAGYMNKVTLKMQTGGLSDSYRVYLETYKAITLTGKLNWIVAFYDCMISYSKFLIRRGLKIIGLNVALKK